MEKPPSFENTSLLEDHEEGPEALASPEALEVMEGAREGRLAILRDFFARLGARIDEKIPKPVQRIASAAVDMTVVSSYKMAAEAIRGKTVTGEVLDAKNRALYGLIAGTNGLAWGLAAAGEIKIAGMSYAASWLLFAAQRTPKVFRDLAEIAYKKDMPSIAVFIERAQRAFSKTSRKDTEAIQKAEAEGNENNS